MARGRPLPRDCSCSSSACCSCTFPPACPADAHRGRCRHEPDDRRSGWVGTRGSGRFRQPGDADDVAADRHFQSGTADRAGRHAPSVPPNGRSQVSGWGRCSASMSSAWGRSNRPSCITATCMSSRKWGRWVCSPSLRSSERHLCLPQHRSGVCSGRRYRAVVLAFATILVVFMVKALTTWHLHTLTSSLFVGLIFGALAVAHRWGATSPSMGR